MEKPAAQALLEEYPLLLQESENRLNCLARMKARLAQAENTPAMQAEIEAYQAQISPLLQQNRARMDALGAAVASLPFALHREVLRLRYLDTGSARLMPWRQVALRLYGDDDPAALQYIRRLHTQALAAIAPEMNRTPLA